MFQSGNENGFYVKSDGSFFAFMDNSTVSLGDALLKAEAKGETKVYPFVGQASTADKDREGEILLQKGLNFAPFKEHGEFNWNHIPHAMTGIPTGEKAWFESPGWKCQGEIISGLPIIPGYTTDMVIQQHNQLKKAGHERGLCLSVEGKVQERSVDGRYVLKADIYNIAHTFRPQNINCTVAMLTKSMAGLAPILYRDEYYSQLHKNLAIQGAEPLMKEDLEGGGGDDEKLIKHLLQKGYSMLEAKRHVYNYLWRKQRHSK